MELGAPIDRYRWGRDIRTRANIDTILVSCDRYRPCARRRATVKGCTIIQGSRKMFFCAPPADR